jgi:primosomal protein N' (replication factor Y)
MKNAEQADAVDQIARSSGFTASLLFGVTGSGKTEVYLSSIERILETRPAAQALLLVPEINLTPQLEARVRARFPAQGVVALHSGLAAGARRALCRNEGRARVVIGTRLAVFASMPQLAAIVVDEEHDASYKAGEGVRYSARDLAVKRAQMLQIPVVLGSATPSLESWSHARSGRYQLLLLRERAAIEERLQPRIELVDPGKERDSSGIAPAIERALADGLERRDQSLVFLNRRGYATVVTCDACGWLSHCPNCAVFAVFHKTDGALHCHHCGWSRPVPRSCPTCGNTALRGVGRGTQRVEEWLQERWPAARIVRVDRTRRAAATASDAFDAVHRGDVDMLVGTQMIAKGTTFGTSVSSSC